MYVRGTPGPLLGALVAVGSDPTITAAPINRDLDKISIWAAEWKVTFNASKSKDVIFSNNKVLNNSPPLITPMSQE